MKKRIISEVLLTVALTAALPVSGLCKNKAGHEEVYDMGRVDFTAQGNKVTAEPVSVDPQKTTIHLDDYNSVTIPQNAGDLVKELVIMDHRGATDLVPDDDTLYMRGFSGMRFTTALDGSAIRKTGGRRSSHIVDYALIPPFMIDSIEVLPGPHSALYPSKSIGGVVNFSTKDPKRHDTRKPDISLSTSYGTYSTQNHSVSLEGSAGDFAYDLGYQNYATEGYLRNNEADINTFYSRLSYLLSNEGHVSFTASYTDADRQIPVNNDPNVPESGFDNNYPTISKASRFYDWQSPTWDKIATSYRLNLKLPSPAGTWNATAFYGTESRDYSMLEWVKPGAPSLGTKDGSWETKWHQQGGKLTNEFSLAEGHVTTVGAGIEQLYDGYGDVPGWDDSAYAHDDKKRVETLAGFAQHEWSILPNLTLTAGLRYENDTIWVSNHSSSSGTIFITGRDMWIERNFSEWSPKSFITYELDDHAAWLRDTSVSAGISRIWRAPDYHGDYNPQGRPTGAWLDPEHGIGYDAVLNRRLFGDIQMKFNYSYYRIRDYITYNRDYSIYWPKNGNPVEPGLEYMDYKINLDEVVRQGIELQFNGSITESLDFMVGWAWQNFKNQGNEPAGETELDNRPENKVTGKLTWQIIDPTRLIFDYEFQDKQITVTSEEISPDVYEFDEIAIDSFHLFNLAVEQTLFEKWNGLKNGILKLYVKNLLDEEHKNISGYPATDRVVGAAFSVQL